MSKNSIFRFVPFSKAERWEQNGPRWSAAFPSAFLRLIVRRVCDPPTSVCLLAGLSAAWQKSCSHECTNNIAILIQDRSSQNQRQWAEKRTVYLLMSVFPPLIWSLRDNWLSSFVLVVFWLIISPSWPWCNHVWTLSYALASRCCTPT